MIADGLITLGACVGSFIGWRLTGLLLGIMPSRYLPIASVAGFLTGWFLINPLLGLR